MYTGFIIKVENLRAHPNADRLQILSIFGTETTVDLSVKAGDIGIYFPTDGQLSVEFAEVNNLVRKKDDAGNQIGGFLDPAKRNIRAINLRGEKSDGLYLPISALDYCYDKEEKAIDHFKVGDSITVVNGHEICCKYIPRSNKSPSTSGGNKTRKKKVAVAPLFAEHADTEQLAYHLSAFKPSDEIEITLKMHGTSQRTGYLPVLKGYKRTLWDRITRKQGTPIYDYGYVSGTRRVVLENYEGGFYGDNQFRERHSKAFEGKLWKGETVYYEVVGFQTSGAPIMASASNSKLNDKEFVKQYGKETVFSYGCVPNPEPTTLYFDSLGIANLTWEKPQSDIYVYRMTMTNPDGDVVEYTPDFMRYRCEQMGIKTVSVFARVILPPAEYFDDEHTVGNYVMVMAEQYYDGPDPIGKTHVREGVVVRIVNRPKFTAYKYKNYSFKVLEGIIKDTAEAPDMEEAQEVENNA